MQGAAAAMEGEAAYGGAFGAGSGAGAGVAASPWGLEELSLSRSGGVSCRAALMLVVAAGRGGRLARVDLSSLPLLGDAPLAALARHCGGSLAALDVSHCRRVSDAGLGEALDACRALSRLVVWGCTQLTGSLFLGHKRAKAPDPYAPPAPPPAAGDAEARRQAAIDDEIAEWARLQIFGRPGDPLPVVEAEI